MNYIRNFFGRGAQKNVDNAQPNKVDDLLISNGANDFVVIERSQMSIPEQRCISRALNVRKASNIINSRTKKNNKTPQQKADMLSDAKSVRKLTEEVKIRFNVDGAYIRGKKGNKFANEINRLKKENKNLLGENEKLKNKKTPLDSLKMSANLCLISKNNAKILHNYICLALAKASNEGRDKQQMQHLFKANNVAEKIAKKYENHFKKITSKISELENLLEMSKPKLHKGIVDIHNKPHALKNYINNKPFENESTEENSTLSERAEAKAEYDKQNRLLDEQRKELSKLRKEHDQINKIFAQYAQNVVSEEELEELRKQP